MSIKSLYQIDGYNVMTSKGSKIIDQNQHLNCKFFVLIWRQSESWSF